MVVVRDDERIYKLAKRSRQVSFIGFGFLIAGFIVLFLDITNTVLYQTVALLVGYGLSQYGIFLAHRYARSPRPDEVLDDAVKPAAPVCPPPPYAFANLPTSTLSE